LSTKKAVIFFFLPARRLFLAGGHEGDGEAGDIGVADEVLGAVQHPVAAVGRAVACMPRRSDPAPGSVIARQSQVSPRMQGMR
jgi:hypothetical protein